MVARLLSFPELTSNASSQEAATFVDLAALGKPEVGQRLRAYRRLAGLSQEELAERSGLSQIEISRLEAHPEKATLRTFVKVCDVLDRTLSDILDEIPVLVTGKEKRKSAPSRR